MIFISFEKPHRGPIPFVSFAAACFFSNCLQDDSDDDTADARIKVIDSDFLRSIKLPLRNRQTAIEHP